MLIKKHTGSPAPPLSSPAPSPPPLRKKEPPVTNCGPIGPCRNNLPSRESLKVTSVATQCVVSPDMLMDQFQMETTPAKAREEAYRQQTRLKTFAANHPHLRINKIQIPVYVINLKRRPDRLDRIVRQFKEFGVTNYHIVEAIDVNKLDSYTYKSDHINMRPNEIACALSHLKATKQYVDTAPPAPHALIVEDDVDLDLMVLWKHSLPDLIVDAPSFDILNVNSYCSNNTTGKYVYELETKYKRCLSAGAYVLTLEAATFLVDESFIDADTYYISGCRKRARDPDTGICRPGTEIMMGQADLRMYELVDRCYSINPPLFTQYTELDTATKYSDVQSDSIFQFMSMTVPIIKRYFEGPVATTV